MDNFVFSPIKLDLFSIQCRKHASPLTAHFPPAFSSRSFYRAVDPILQLSPRFPSFSLPAHSYPPFPLSVLFAAFLPFRSSSVFFIPNGHRPGLSSSDLVYIIPYSPCGHLWIDLELCDFYKIPHIPPTFYMRIVSFPPETDAFPSPPVSIPAGAMWQPERLPLLLTFTTLC